MIWDATSSNSENIFLRNDKTASFFSVFENTPNIRQHEKKALSFREENEFNRQFEKD
jgi:hypothetical protein